MGEERTWEGKDGRTGGLRNLGQDSANLKREEEGEKKNEPGTGFEKNEPETGFGPGLGVPGNQNEPGTGFEPMGEERTWDREGRKDVGEERTWDRVRTYG